MMNLQKFLGKVNLTYVLAFVAVLLVVWLLWVGSSFMGFEGFDGTNASNQLDVSKGNTVVLFYAPWCPHCKTFKPIWDKLTAKHKGDPKVNVKEVNCETNPKEGEKHGVQGFPTVMLFKDGKKVAQHNGDRSEESVENFIVSNAK